MSVRVSTARLLHTSERKLTLLLFVRNSWVVIPSSAQEARSAGSISVFANNALNKLGAYRYCRYLSTWSYLISKDAPIHSHHHWLMWTTFSYRQFYRSALLTPLMPSHVVALAREAWLCVGKREPWLILLQGITPVRLRIDWCFLLQSS